MTKKIIIGILLFSGLVFAAAQTKYYGDILMQGHKIIGLATDPSDSTSAATKGYVDAADATKLPLSGGSSKPMTGNLYMGTSNDKHQIKNVASPSSDYDAANKTWTVNTFLPRSGGNITGTIDMNFHPLINPSTNNIAWNYVVNRRYVNQEDELVASNANAALTNLAANVDSALANKLSKAGGRMTGTLDMGTNYIVRVHGPRSGETGALDAVNKQYVNGTFLPLTGGDLSGRLNMNGNFIINLADPTNSTQAATKGYVDGVSNTKFDKSGGPINGQISMTNHRIYNLGAPLLDHDAATKEYVDTTINSASVYQYFALRMGGKYDPFVNLGTTSNGFFDVVVLKEFSGAITSYFDGAPNFLLSGSFPSRKWKVGEVIRIHYDFSHVTGVNTNGTLFVKSNHGVIGNWGVSYRILSPEPAAPPMINLQFDSRAVGPDSSLDLSNFVSSRTFSFTIKNIGASISEAFLELEPAYTYDAEEDEIQVWLDVRSSSYYSRSTINLYNLSSGESTPVLVSIPYSNDTGFKWSFIIRGETTDGQDFSFRFGQFFIPAVL